MEDQEDISLFTEEPFYNDSFLYDDTIARLNNLTLNLLNIPWENVLRMLTDWQKDQLMDIDSEPGVECLLGNWFKNKMENIDTETVYCNATWDKTYCLPTASVGTKLMRKCYSVVQGVITRVCLDNGTWSQGDICERSYESLSSIFDRNGYLSVIVGHMVFIGSILSFLCLVVSLAIFYCLRSIWTQRLTLQVHLMLVLLLRFVLLFVITEPFISNRSNTYRNDDFLCKFLISAYLYSSVALVMWMLIQGIYLNGKLTTNVLGDESKNKIRFYYFLGWLFPAVVLVAYLVVMIANQHHEMCWKGYPEMIEIWIILAPILVALSLNAIFLLNILRVVISKSHGLNSASESSKLVSIAKATGILFPVLGINNMLLIYNPGGEFEKYFILLNAFFGSTQGVLVAIVYCLKSKDVQQAVRLSYNRFLVRRGFQDMPRIAQRDNFLLRNLSKFSREQSTNTSDTHNV